MTCPRCGLEVFDKDIRGEGPFCNPVRSPGCWRVVGKSRNGSPILRVVDERKD